MAPSGSMSAIASGSASDMPISGLWQDTAQNVVSARAANPRTCSTCIITSRRRRKCPEPANMHPPLHKPHPMCQEVINALVECHEEYPYRKFVGACNEAKAALDKCFRLEKEERRKENLRKAREEEERFEKTMAVRKQGLRRDDVEAGSPQA